MEFDFEDFKNQLAKIGDKNTCGKEDNNKREREKEINNDEPSINTLIEAYFYHIFKNEDDSIISRDIEYKSMKSEYQNNVYLYYILNNADVLKKIENLSVRISLFEYIGNKKIENSKTIYKSKGYTYHEKISKKEIKIEYYVNDNFEINIIFPDIQKDEYKEIIERITMKFAGFYLIIYIDHKNDELYKYLALEFKKGNSRSVILNNAEGLQIIKSLIESESNKKIKL